MAPTIYDIAEHAGVSTATVSRVFNDSSSVSEDTRADVMKAAQSLGYKPHASAQSLAGQRTHLIAAVVPILANHFYLGVMRGMQDALSTSDFDLLVYTPSHPMEVEEQIKRASQRGRSDGLLMLSAPVTDDMAAHLSQTPQEVVLVDTDHSGFESITIDNQRAGKKATRHLLDLGYERIAHITADTPEPPPATQRRQGYEQALVEANAAQSPIVARGDKEPFAFEKEGGYRAMKDLLRRSPHPDAVFAASDMQALGALRAIDEAGLLVPDDIAVLGFDDVSISQYVGLSTLRQPLHDFGTLAIEKVVARLNDPDRTISSTVFNPELVVRDTCGGDGGS